MASESIQVKDVHKRYTLGARIVEALRGVSLDIPSGAFCAIIGPSGSGKSTLLNMIGLLDHPDSGSVLLDGADVSTLSAKEAAATRHERIGFVFQDFNLIPVLTVFENVELPLHAAGSSLRRFRSVDERRHWVSSLIEAVGLGDWARHRPMELSGGQQQRVAIARALVNRPDVVIADEPTANLDSATGQEILTLMDRFNRDSGTTFVFSTHDAAVRDIATMTVALRDGAVVSS